MACEFENKFRIEEKNLKDHIMKHSGKQNTEDDQRRLEPSLTEEERIRRELNNRILTHETRQLLKKCVDYLIIDPCK